MQLNEFFTKTKVQISLDQSSNSTKPLGIILDAPGGYPILKLHQELDTSNIHTYIRKLVCNTLKQNDNPLISNIGDCNLHEVKQNL